MYTHARLNVINAHPTPYTYLEYSSIKVSTIIVRRGASILRLQEKGIVEVVILRKTELSLSEISMFVHAMDCSEFFASKIDAKEVLSQ